MTDCFHSLTVTLDRDLRDDDAALLISAIKMLRGVLDVQGEVSDHNLHTAHLRARHELGKKLMAILYSTESL